MKKNRGLLIALLVVVTSVSGHRPQTLTPKSYTGYQVIRVKASTPDHIAFLNKLELAGDADFWKGPLQSVNSWNDILVSPERRDNLFNALAEAGMQFSIMIDDVKELAQGQQQTAGKKLKAPRMSWDEYHRVGTIYEYLDSLPLLYPDLVSVENYGVSYEGRYLKLVKLSKGGLNEKRALWIDAAIHPREWVSTSTVLYFINHILTDPSATMLLNDVDFYFAPMLNPDGYEYTFTHDRMWKKTLTPNNGSSCIGTDINRNFAYQWGTDDMGSSPDPCSEIHRGKAPWSEVESRAMRDYILQRPSVRWTAFLSFHSYSQSFMLPFGYSKSIVPTQYNQMMGVAERAVEALRAVRGTDYVIGQLSHIFFLANGHTMDWAVHDVGFKWGFTIDLPDTGEYGYLLPPDRILQTANETWAALQSVVESVINLEM